MDTQMELLTEKWNNILQSIREDNGLSDVAFKTWLLPLKIFRIEDKLLKITAPLQSWAEETLLWTRRAAQSVLARRTST